MTRGDKRKFAVFDIDGTIVRTGLFFQVVDELLAADKLPAKFRAQLDAKLDAYHIRIHKDAFNDYNQAIVDILFANLPLLAVVDYREAVDTVIERTRGRTYVYTRNLIQRLLADNYFLIALSGSEDYAIKRFMEPYNFDLVVGDSYHEKDGRFTGEIDTIFHDKGAALKSIVDEQGLSYEESLAIGDSAGDAKMLELVEQPIAFNPEAKLLDLATSRGWKVIVERKNVIYTLEPRDGSYILAKTD